MWRLIITLPPPDTFVADTTWLVYPCKEAVSPLPSASQQAEKAAQDRVGSSPPPLMRCILSAALSTSAQLDAQCMYLAQGMHSYGVGRTVGQFFTRE